MAKKVVSYTRDDGKEVFIEVDARYEAQAALSLTESSGEAPISVGGRFKPRTCLVVDSTGKKRRLACGLKTATAYTVMGTTVTIYHGANDATGTAGKVYGYEGERLIWSPSTTTFG